jgi:hypothetical protein
VATDVSALKQAWVEYVELVWNAAAKLMEDKVREAAEPHRKTGEMAASIRTEFFQASEAGASGMIEVAADYASYVDTGRGPVVPVNAKVLRFSVGGSTVFTMYSSAYPGSKFFESTVTDPTWGDCVEQAASGITVFA